MGTTGTLVRDCSHPQQAEPGAERRIAGLGLDLGCGKTRVSWTRQGVWEQVLRCGEGNNSLYLSPSRSLCSGDLMPQDLGFRGENTDVWKCPLATENLQFTNDVCRIV